MKPVRASPLFDIPQSCLDWIRVAEKNGLIRDAQVMAWKVDTYSDGSPARDKHGRPKKAWLSYHATDADGLPNDRRMIGAYKLTRQRYVNCVTQNIRSGTSTTVVVERKAAGENH